MRFNSQSGKEMRTWILFFVGLALVGFFAWTRNPLNPWWTLIIGAFTCTAIIVSAVQSLVGGMGDAARKAVEDAKRDDPNHGPKESGSETFSVDLGLGRLGFVRGVRNRHAAAV